MRGVRSIARQGHEAHQGQVDLLARLSARAPEIERAVLTRVHSLEDPTKIRDPTYTAGLKAAVSAGIAYAITGIERGESRPAPVPTALLAQARLAARTGVALDTVLRRYFAGHTVLGDFLEEEAAGAETPSPATLRRLRRDQAALLERLLAAVAEEYERESGAVSSPARRRMELIKRLLDGELLETTEFAYELEAHHLAVVASHPEAEGSLRVAAARLDRQLLIGTVDGNGIWAWLGGRTRLEPSVLVELLAQALPEGQSLALGEPGQGLEGWRLSHRQAAAASVVVRHGLEPVVRYAEVSLLASALCDELLVLSLRQLFLSPLAGDRDDGGVLRDTLRAYFRADRNSASAAAALGVTRQTVNNRLRLVEERLGTSLQDCAAELELALRLDSLR